MSGLISCSIQNGLLQDHLHCLRAEYKKRMQVATEYLRDNLPQNFHFETPHGGYFIWIKGPDNFDGTLFSHQALKHGVQVLPGERAAGNRSDPRSCQNAIRVSIAYYGCESLLEGCQRLCHALSLDFKNV